MDLDDLLKPNVPKEMVIDLVRKIYGLKVTNIKSMASFNDQNFYIQVSKQHQNPYLHEVSNDGYTLKIINTLKSSLDGHFDSMHSAMRHLDRKGIRVPLPLKNLDGNTWKLETVPLLNEGKISPKRRKCGITILTFIQGIPVTAIQNTPDVLFKWGSLMARFHIATENLSCQKLRNKTILYSLEHVPDIERYMGCLDDHRKEVIFNVLLRYQTEIAKNISKLPKGFIHGDFNGNNILTRMEKADLNNIVYSVDGVLDFEDMHYGTYLWDIGFMLAHVLLDCTDMDSLQAAGHALAGYMSLRRLSDLEQSLLKMTIECRICQTLVLCAYSSRLDPSNSYVSSCASTDTKWSLLQQLSTISASDLQLKWNNILLHYSKSQ